MNPGTVGGITTATTAMTATIAMTTNDRDDRVSGNYVILRAEYGNGRTRVDVTSRLREIGTSDRTLLHGQA